jgi:hypothetical protein
MKQFILFIILMGVGTLTYGQKYDFDIIYPKDFMINNLVSGSPSIDRLLKKLGKPDKTEYYYSEIEGDTAQIMHYDRIGSFKMFESGMNRINLVGPDAFVRFKEADFRIGDPVKDLEKVFPLSYQNRRPSYTAQPKTGFLSLPFGFKNKDGKLEPVDSGVSIFYDLKTEMMKKITCYVADW